MIGAVWFVGAFIVLIYFGTWALQIDLWLLMIGLRVIGFLTWVLLGASSLIFTAVRDPKGFRRLVRQA